MYLQMHILHKCLQSCVKTKKRERETDRRFHRTRVQELNKNYIYHSCSWELKKEAKAN